MVTSQFILVGSDKKLSYFKEWGFFHNLFNLLLLLSLLTGTINGFAANIKVFTDRNPVRLNESFTLVFEVNGVVSDNPDFSPLRSDFDIINQSQSSQINIINGQQNSTKQWKLMVMAKQTGNLVIPSISFGQDRSTPSIIKVQKAQSSQSDSDNANLFLEVGVEPENLYVQSQVIYTVRLFYAINLNNASLSEPKLKGGEGIVEKLGEDVQYETQRDGKRFAVLERKYAIFPQQSGDISIEPLMLEAKILEGKRSRSLFDDFDFFGQSRTRTRRLHSKAIPLKVKPIPETFKGQHWLPAKQLNLKENWSENLPDFKAGEPVTRTLTLLAEGLTAGQLPEFSQFTDHSHSQSTSNTSLSQGADNGDLKQYPDKPKLDEQKTAQGIISHREEKVAIIPSAAGNYTLPAIEIPWWNTKTNQMEIARLPARTIKIHPADNVPQSILPTPITVSPLPSDKTSSLLKNPLLPPTTTTNYWTWLSIILAFGWISTIIVWWLTRRTTNSNPASKPNTLNNKATFKQLKQACYSNDIKQVKKALLTWAKVHWQASTPNNLGEISKRCSEPLQTEIQSLNQFLYRQNHAENWQGSGLWEAFKAYHAQIKKTSEKTVVDNLEPLYKTIS